MSKKSALLGVAVACALVVPFLQGQASATEGHEGHGGTTGGYGAPASSAHSGHEGHGARAAAPAGVLLREAKVQGHALTYRLYSWDERNVMMKGMEGHDMPGMDKSGKATNHLMLFIKGADGAVVSGAKAGFLIVGPDKAEQKTLTMGMGGGYGADVELKAKGVYTIKTKAVVGGATLVEEFTHTVK